MNHNENSPSLTRVVVARGDGIGPEIMDATLRVLHAAGAKLDITEIAVGESAYLNGSPSGISADALELIRSTGVILKAPVTTPQGGGFKSLNVTLRKTFGLYANVRPTVSYDPVIPTPRPGVDLVIIRENEEDLYAGIEYRHSPDVVQGIKLITRDGCARIARYAFEYARAHGRTKVTAMSKDNIMKMADGMFRAEVEKVAAEYPEISYEHMIIDIGTAKVAATPEQFDVIVTLNLYGDILSDVASQVVGSVGLAPSANIGGNVAMFEAIHGSAPDIAGQGIANPSGLLLAAVQMLVHIGQVDVAQRIQDAWSATIEAGIRTGDLADGAIQVVGTAEFADAIIERLGQQPAVLTPATFSSAEITAASAAVVDQAAAPVSSERVGVDLFVHHTGDLDELVAELREVESGALTGTPLTLQLISNRGQAIWPNAAPDTLRCDQYRCRITAANPLSARDVAIIHWFATVAGVDVVKTETLFRHDGVDAFSKAQGA